MGRFLAVVLAAAVLVPACGSDSAPGDVPAATATLRITASAGPVCPVETDPPSPECAPRPVEAALIVVTGPSGTEVARGTTGPDGRLVLDVPPGELVVTPQPVDGLLGTAAAVTVTAIEGRTVPVDVDYDTGIR
jgi:hypothetical protein